MNISTKMMPTAAALLVGRKAIIGAGIKIETAIGPKGQLGMRVTIVDKRCRELRELAVGLITVGDDVTISGFAEAFKVTVS